MKRNSGGTHHLGTVSHDGRFWDAYLEFLEDAGNPGGPVRGRVAFSAAGQDEEPVRTTTIFVEETAQEVLSRARDFKTHQLVALLRSAIPADD